MPLLPGIIAMALVVVTSNILVQVLILDGLLTWAAFTYPIAFLVTDVMNRLYGTAAARKVVLVGFAVGILCSLIGSQITLSGEYGEFQAVAVRVAIGSGIAFLAAQLLDVAIFAKLRDGSWWTAPFVSSVAGSIVDTVLFFTIAFSALISFGRFDEEILWAQEAKPLLTVGPEVPYWITLALADWAVKITVALIALIPFRLIVASRRIPTN